MFIKSSVKARLDQNHIGKRSILEIGEVIGLPRDARSSRFITAHRRDMAHHAASERLEGKQRGIRWVPGCNWINIGIINFPRNPAFILNPFEDRWALITV